MAVKHNQFAALELMVDGYFGKDPTRSTQAEITVRQAIDQVRGQQNSLMEKFEAIPKEIPIISPATQWAQSVRDVFLRVKFATRTDSPACLEISELVHDLKEQMVKVSALCRNDKKFLRYVLELPLDNPINVDKSTVEVESVGRLLIKLEKLDETYWKSLWPSDFLKPKNLSLGWEMQGRYDEELKKKFPDLHDKEESSEGKGVFSIPEKPYVPSDLEEDAEEVEPD